MPELEIGHVDGGEFNFNQSFLQFNLKKKIYAKNSLKEHSRFDWKCWLLDTASLSNELIATIMSTFTFTIALLSEKNKIF